MAFYRCVPFVRDAVSGDLPDGYTRASYIVSSGAQYIDTGFVATMNTSISACFAKVTGKAPHVISSGDSTSDGIIITNWATGPSLACKFGNSQFTPTARIYLYIDDEFITVTVNKDYVSVKDFVWELNSSEIGSSQNICIMKGIWKGSHCAKTKSVVIHDSSELKHSFIAAVRNSDNKPCMFDTVTGQPFYNMGTGEFGYELMDGTYVAPI